MSSTKTSSWAPAKQALAKVQRGTIRKLRAPEAAWPQPENSIGEFEATIKDKSYWKVSGPAREAWTKIWPEIKSHLDAHTEPIGRSFVTVEIHMIGPTPETSAPTILFLCEEESHRKAACKTIKRSNILYDYEGIRVAHMPRTPASTGRLVLMTARNPWASSEPHNLRVSRNSPSARHQATHHAGSGQHSRRPRADSLGESEDEDAPGYLSQPRYKIPQRIGPAYKVYSDAERIRSGVTLNIESPHYSGQMTTATVGGAVRINDTIYIVTSAHPFTGQETDNTHLIEATNELTFVDEEPNELTFVDSENASDESDDEVLVPSYPSNLNWSNAHKAPEVSNDTFSKPGDAILGSLHHAGRLIGRLSFSSIEQSKPELDYALITVQVAEHLLDFDEIHNVNMDGSAMFTTEEDFRSLTHRSVFSVVGSAPQIQIEGTIDTNPASILLPFAHRYQEVYEVKFESALKKGDSGSWVRDAENGLLHGHIVAGSPKDGIAYVVPYYRVCADMKATFAIRRWNDDNREVQRALLRSEIAAELARLESEANVDDRSFNQPVRPMPLPVYSHMPSDGQYVRTSAPLGISNLRRRNEGRSEFGRMGRFVSEDPRHGHHRYERTSAPLGISNLRRRNEGRSVFGPMGRFVSEDRRDIPWSPVEHGGRPRYVEELDSQQFTARFEDADDVSPARRRSFDREL